MWLIVVAFAFASPLKPTSDGCKALCVRDGYTTGQVFKSGCACVDVKVNYDDYVNRRLNLGKPEDTRGFVLDEDGDSLFRSRKY